MQSQARLLDDLAQLAGGAVHVVSGMGSQIRQNIKAHAEETASRLDLVPREDVDRLEARLDKLQKDHQDMAERLKALESEKASKKSKSPSTAKTTKKRAS